MNIEVIVPSAGSGSRLGAKEPKALIDLCGEPLLVRTLKRLGAANISRRVIIPIPQDNESLFSELLTKWNVPFDYRLIPGGKERQFSVLYALRELSEDTKLVVIHDAARPFVPVECICSAVEAATVYGAATVAIPCTDTILEGDTNGFLVHTPNREKLWACQTPQVFRRDLITHAHEKALENQLFVTDDATLVRMLGHPVKIVPGDPLNIKITTPMDLKIAQVLIEKGLA